MISDKVLARKALRGGELTERKQSQYTKCPSVDVGAGEPLGWWRALFAWAVLTSP